MKKHLRTFINYLQDNWADKLLMAEYVTKNGNFASTKLSLFFTVIDVYPRISF